MLKKKKTKHEETQGTQRKNMRHFKILKKVFLSRDPRTQGTNDSQSSRYWLIKIHELCTQAFPSEELRSIHPLTGHTDLKSNKYQQLNSVKDVSGIDTVQILAVDSQRGKSAALAWPPRARITRFSLATPQPSWRAPIRSGRRPRGLVSGSSPHR